MNFLPNILRPLLFLLGFGLGQRLFLLVTSVSFFKSGVDILYSLLFGFVFDISFLSGLFLAAFILQLFIFKKVLHVLFGIIVGVWVILNGCDIFSFHYLGMRTSVNSLNFFKVSDLTNKISASGVSFLVLAYLLLSIIFLWKYKRKLMPDFTDISLKGKVYLVASFSLFSFVYLPYPINYYTAQFNSSREANQAALNPYYSWFTSIADSHEPFKMDAKVALANFRRDLEYPETQTDFLEREVNYTDSSYNSIILIMMESFGANRIGMLGGEKGLSPNFDSLCKQGILYKKSFACGPRTQYGVSSAMFGFPHVLGYNLFRKNKLKLPFKGLSSVLNETGYRTYFIHGGDASYDDMSLLLKSEKATIKDATGITRYKFKNSWGVDDESLYKYAEQNISADGKGFYCILTMSNHEPFQVPEDFNPKEFNGLSKSEKTFFYSDYALGNFIRELKRSKKFEKSLIIITGDHGEHYTEKDLETKLYHVPLLIIDHKNKGIINNTVCSHSDIAEYILSKTGYKGKSHFIGQSLVNNKRARAYYRDYSDDLYRVTDTVIYAINLKDLKVRAVFCNDRIYVNKIQPLGTNENLVRNKMLSYYTTMKFIFENGLYTSR